MLNEARYPAVEDYAARLADKYLNGWVLFRSFLLPAHPVIDWYAPRYNLEGMLFFHRFWFAPTPASMLSQLRVADDYNNNPPFLRGDSFTFAGELASALFRGGAYEYSSGTGAAEMELGLAAAHELMQDRYAEVMVYANRRAWTPAFCDVAWDHSWMLVDPRLHCVHTLFATDTD